jgi:hypothetical protein
LSTTKKATKTAKTTIAATTKTGKTTRKPAKKTITKATTKPTKLAKTTHTITMTVPKYGDIGFTSDGGVILAVSPAKVDPISSDVAVAAFTVHVLRSKRVEAEYDAAEELANRPF